MKKNVWNYAAVVAGVILFGIGLVLIKTIAETEGIMLTLPYVLIGIGCGSFGHGMGAILSQRATVNNPELAKQIEIETKDERNVAIGNQAKAKAYDMMVFAFGALMLSFALMNVDMMVILLLVITYLFVVGYGIYYRLKLDKEM